MLNPLLMIVGDESRRLAWVAAFLTTLFLGAGTTSFAQDPFEDLRIRIEQLEQDNLEFRQALSNSGADFIPLVSELPPKPEDAEGAASLPDDQKMESLVEGMMRRLSAQSQADFEARNKKIADLESRIQSLKKPSNPTGVKGNFGNGGLVFTSNDGNFKYHFGGTVQLDFIAPQSTASGISGFANKVAAPGVGSSENLTQDSTNFRRIRARMDGSMYGRIDYVLETEMSSTIQNTANPNTAAPDNGLRSIGTLNGGLQGGNTQNFIQPANVWVVYKQIPIIGNVRVGNQFDWLSLEHLQGGRFNDFMERAPIFDAFTGASNNGFTPGVSVFNNTPDKMAGLQLGVYKNNVYDSTNTFSIGNAFIYGGRVMWTPYYDEASEGRYLVHTAIGSEYRTFTEDPSANQNGQNIRIRSRGDLRMVSAQLTPNFADTGNFYVTGQELVNPEIAVVWGPWTLQAEYTASWFNGARTTQLSDAEGGKSLGNVFMYGGYAEALYFLTGENKVYDRVRGVFSQVVPKNNFNMSQGKYGAWQLGARYDSTDLNSGLISGGRNQNGTIGLNWFLNPNLRFQFNTVLSYVDNVGNPAFGAGTIGGTASSGTLQSSKFIGDGLIVTLGTRMDLSF